MQNFGDLFTGLGCFEREYEIKLKKDAQAVAHPPRRVPQAIMRKLKAKLDDLVKNRVIRKMETDEYSEWVHYLHTVEKKDAERSLRICVDPQELNANIADEHTYIPTFDDLSSKLANIKYFSVLDLKDGFWHVKLAPESQKLCTIATPFGNYQFLRMPFGLKIGPSVFQRKNFETFGDIENVTVFHDDILIAGRDKKEHDETLIKVLQRAREKNVRFNINKMQIATTQVKYVGHIFSHNEIKPDPDRLIAIEQMGCPTNKTDLQTFLGVINFMRQYIPNLSEKTATLRELIKKNVLYKWTQLHTKVMNDIKQDVINSNVLVPFDESKPISIECDASQHGLGCCLIQDGQPISFASRSLNKFERNYSQIEKEMLSILFACTKFHFYTYGRPVKVVNDHKPLLGIMKKELHKIASAKLQRMKLKLFNYDIKLEHAPGKSIPLADYLSRYEIQSTESDEDKTITQAILSINVSDERKKEIQRETENDKILKQIKTYCMLGWPNHKSKCPSEIRYFYRFKNDIFIEDELLFYNDRLIIPSKMRQTIVNKLHEPHFGIGKTLQRARMSVFWPQMNNEIESVVMNCKICQENAPSNKKEPMIPHQIPNKPFDKIGCDILEHTGKNYLVAIDYFSKWIELVKLKNKTASEINMQLLRIFATHGYPSTIIADNVPFGSYECVEFAKQHDITITTSSPRYPQSNGLAERAVQICKNILKKSQNEEQSLKALMAYRTTPIKYMNYSPAELIHNRIPRTDLPMHNKKFIPKLCHDVENQIKNKQEKMKTCYDKTAKQKNTTFVNSQNILFRNNNKWQHGQIQNKHQTPRSFVVQSEGRVYRRNTRHIRPYNQIIAGESSPEKSPALHHKFTRSGQTY